MGNDSLPALAGLSVSPGRGFIDLSEWLEALHQMGWSAERLAKNELPTEAIGLSYNRASFEVFWKTIGMLADACNKLDMPAIFVKCLRAYRYYDSNVDLVVSPVDRWPTIVKHLSHSNWRMPSPVDRAEQFVVERRKLKLPPNRDGILPAHLYGGVRWGYQADTALLRYVDGAPDPQQLDQIGIAEISGSKEVQGSIYHPNCVADLVVHAAHIVFENFRMTLGEAVHVHLVLQHHPDVRLKTRLLAQRYGFAHAVELIFDVSEQIMSEPQTMDPRSFPLPIPKRRLQPCWIERRRHMLKRGELAEAAIEEAGCRAFYTLRRTIRYVRRLQRGQEDRRAA